MAKGPDHDGRVLATVIDCYSRRLVGWAVADHARTELVEDEGSSKAYAKLYRRLGVTQPMGAVGASADI